MTKPKDDMRTLSVVSTSCSNVSRERNRSSKVSPEAVERTWLTT